MIRMLVLSFVTLTFLSPMAQAQKPEEKAQAEMMQKMMAAATPGDAHKVLAGMAGDYVTTMKGWMAAGAKPFEGKGTASLKMILGGRWLQQTIHQDAVAQMPAFDGHGMIGYDNVKKAYVSIWTDTQSTSAMIGEGQFNAATKTLKDAGSYSCAVTSEPRNYRAEWLIKDKNNLVFSLFGTSPFDPSNKEFKMLEIAYKRK